MFARTVPQALTTSGTPSCKLLVVLREPVKPGKSMTRSAATVLTILLVCGELIGFELWIDLHHQG